MKINEHTRKDIEDITFDVLKQSKALGVFPTPVDKIVQYCNLNIEENNHIDHIPSNYLTKSKELLKKALRKVKGALDRREKIIYVDSGQIASRKNFVKLHEAGHEIIPWQRDFYELIQDDETTLSLDNREEFEFEANFFASASLFQLDRFDEEANKLPLGIESPMALAKKFGGSNHASLRRYVQRSPKKCGLLVLEQPSRENLVCGVRNYFQSASFTIEFGNITWKTTLGLEWPFALDYVNGRKFKKDGYFEMEVPGIGKSYFDYHYFNNKWNAFILIKPTGEVNKSRARIILK